MTEPKPDPLARLLASMKKSYEIIERMTRPLEPYVDHDEPVGDEPLAMGDTTYPASFYVTGLKPGQSVTLDVVDELGTKALVVHDLPIDGERLRVYGTPIPLSPELIADGWRWGRDDLYTDPTAVPTELIEGLDVDEWLAWALPAITDVLAGHIPFDVDSPGPLKCYHPETGNAESFDEWIDWREHVGPIIAKRIACDPQRAIAALRTLL